MGEEKEGAVSYLIEQIQRTPELRKINPTPLFRGFVENLAPWLALTETAWATLEAFSNINIDAGRIARIIRSNPYLEYHFLEVFHSIKKRAAEDEDQKLESMIIRYGMNNTRNLILTIQLKRVIQGVHPKRGADGKLDINPAETLKYAIHADSFFEGQQESFGDSAFAAGLLFDLLGCATVIIKDPAHRKRVLEYIDSIYKHGFLTGRIAKELARSFSQFSYSKYVFSASLIHDAGKVVMAILDADYLAISEQCSRAGLPLALRPYLERIRFGLDHSHLGTMICREFRFFDKIQAAIKYHHEPFLVKPRSDGNYSLCALVSLSSNIANNPSRISGVSDPALNGWFGLELEDFKIDIGALKGILDQVI